MRLDDLILIRLATIKKLAPGKLANDLRPLVAVDDFKKVFDDHIRRLVAGGWIKLRTPRVTDTGRARALQVLGVKTMPDWKRVRSRYLPALALGVAPETARDLEAVIVARLLIKHLRLTPTEFDPHQIIKKAVAAEMSVDVTAEDLQAEIQTALVRRWVGDITPPWTDAEVIAAVRSATANVPATGRFGGDRVFVSAIWRQLDESARFPGLTLDGLKKRLVEANREQHLTLARADLVAAMDPREVAASEIRVLNSRFHFVVDRSRS